MNYSIDLCTVETSILANKYLFSACRQVPELRALLIHGEVAEDLRARRESGTVGLL